MIGQQNTKNNFNGCIKELVVNNKPYKLAGRYLLGNNAVLTRLLTPLTDKCTFKGCSFVSI